MDEYTKDWDHAESPLLWVEMIYSGDTEVMQKYFNFLYSPHYFLSKNQVATFYKNIEAEKAAQDFGAIKFADREFVAFFCAKSQEIENQLFSVIAKIKQGLSQKSQKELLQLYAEFFNSYSALAGFYRLTRPDFYEGIIKKLKKDFSEEQLNIFLTGGLVCPDAKTQQLIHHLKLIGERRLAMHRTWMGAYNQALPLFEAIGKQIGFSSIEVQNCTKKEIEEALTSQKIPDQSEVQKRIQHFKFQYCRGFFELSFPSKEDFSFPASLEIKGTPAFAGKVTGKVAKLTESLSGASQKAMETMPEGSVLVTEMTSPDMLLAIKKASAIITDAGGMLCHAAILAREFKIPCIVGTGQATRLLNDGELIEVDAFNGLIRKLK